MKRYALMLLLLLMPLSVLAEEYQTIKTVAAQIPNRWTQTYQTPWRTIEIDVMIEVPDVSAWPVLYTEKQPTVSKALLRQCSESYVNSGVLYNLHIGKDYARKYDDVQQSVVYPGPELPTVLAENTLLTPTAAFQTAVAELERYFTLTPDSLTLESTEVRGILYSKGGIAKSATGEYVFHLRQHIGGIGYRAAADCYEDHLPFSLQHAGNGEAYARISDDHLYLTASPTRIAAAITEDIPLLSFESVKAVFEAEIHAGRLRSIESLELGFIPFSDPQDAEHCYLLPAWVAQGGYTMDAQEDFSPQYDETGYMIDSGKHLNDVVVLAQTGELLDYTDSSPTRRIYRGYITWDDVQH